MKNLLLALSILVAVSCTSNKTQVLKVGLNAEYHPYEYIEGDDFKGFNVEIVETILSNMGAEYELVNMSFDGLLAALQTKKVDIVIGVSATESRRQMVDFTLPYTKVDDEVVLIHRDNQEIYTLDNLDGKTFGVQLGTLQEQLARNNFPNSEIKTFNSYTPVMLDLNNKKLDAVVVSKNPSIEYLAQNTNLVLLGSVNNSISSGYALAINKDQENLLQQLNQEIEKIINDGTANQLMEKYKI